MKAVILRLSDFLQWAASPRAASELSAAAGVPVVGVTLEGEMLTPADADTIRALPCVLVGLAGATRQEVAPALASLFDVALPADAFDALAEKISANPVAATTLALLLRHSQSRTWAEGLIAESSAYSVLQSGSEFTRWRETHPVRPVTDADTSRVATFQRDGEFHIRLTRPARRNAFDSRMRDALDDAFVQAEEAQAQRIVLSGEGPSFCAGGDLDEFGSRSDPAAAHLTRLSCSPPRRMAIASSRLEARVYGACVGSGIELAAFASRVIAAPDATFALPEVSMGLIPGAGGTVSIARRIGRQRTAWLALSGQFIDAEKALAWGLVDSIENHPNHP